VYKVAISVEFWALSKIKLVVMFGFTENVTEGHYMWSADGI